MNRLMIGVALAGATLTAASNASAADMPVKAPRVAYDPCGAARFTGFYAGGNTGAVAYTASRNDLDNFLTDANTYSANKIGWTAGAQVGYDWQSCNKVFGIVADWNWASTSANTADEPNDDADLGVQGYQSKLRWFSTLRARAGLAVDDTLFYVTGGLAAGKTRTTITEGDAGNTQTATFDKTRWGVALGAGAEFALWNNWSVNAELLYLQFQKEQVIVNTNTQGPARFDLGRQRLGCARRAQLSLGQSARRLCRRLSGQGRCADLWVRPAALQRRLCRRQYRRRELHRRPQRSRRLPARQRHHYSATKGAVTGGAQIGWDWQSCHRLLGLVADWNWTSAKAKPRDNPNDPTDPDQGFKSKLSSFGTIRGRAGLVADDSMIYVTGGVAAAKIKTTITEGDNVLGKEVNTFDRDPLGPGRRRRRRIRTVGGLERQQRTALHAVQQGHRKFYRPRPTRSAFRLGES